MKLGLLQSWPGHACSPGKVCQSQRPQAACASCLSVHTSKTSAAHIFWFRVIDTYHVLLCPIPSGFPLGLLMIAGNAFLFQLYTLLFEDLNGKRKVKFLTTKILKRSG